LFSTDASTPVAASYPAHPATERFNLMTAFPFARSVSPVAGGVDGRTAQTIVETGAQSWAETNLACLLADGRVAMEEDQGDVAGAVSLAAAVSAAATEAPAAEPAEEGAEPPPAPQSRLIAFGDSDFAANFGLGIQGNRDL